MTHEEAAAAPKTVGIRGVQDLLEALPPMIGYQPAESLVIAGFDAPKEGRGLLKVVMCYPLGDDPSTPDPLTDEYLTDLYTHAGEALERSGCGAATLAIYLGDKDTADLIARVGVGTLGANFPVVDVVRISEGRYWSYLCTDKDCCPPEGNPVLGNADIAKTLADAGLDVAATRDEKMAVLDPPLAEELAAVIDATEAVKATAMELFDVGHNPDDVRTVINQARRSLVDAIKVYEAGGKLALPDLVWIAMTIPRLEVRDEAWVRMGPDHTDAHVDLWKDVLRASIDFRSIASAASLLGFCCWLAGDGALANAAINRALDARPGYKMAELIGECLYAGIPPAYAAKVMASTPEEIAAHYKMDVL